ncbi:MAG: UDP-N-acetylglucosamine 1-carboxyvinyltransferase [Clostridia bacterium]|nr:UDP-N-acetylglucosamine 1-carboxyvinyltransferase [Clostridia bacterium]
MENIIINGGRELHGSVKLQGSKNSILPILAASAATGGVSVLHNCPKLSDVEAAIAILRHIGCKVQRKGHTVIVDSSDVNGFEIPDSLMREMRSSIVFLGALLARFGKAKVSAPGGCEIGLRPIDLHLCALRRMGTSISEEGGMLECKCPDGLFGRHVTLNFPSVGATENIMLAAMNAKGETVITNAAREPEIVDLAEYLNKCGMNITGAGQSVIRISGGKISGAEHRIIPDRIVASTFMAAVACAGGRINVKDVEKEHLAPVIPVFENAGCIFDFNGKEMTVESFGRPRRVRLLRTMPYPGFPTDSQALFMAVAAKASGTSIISEKIFENRFRHVPELIKMGADIRVEDCCVAVVEGVKKLHGARVTACDLRGGSALAVAATGAEGQTVIENIHHIDRGCEAFEETLSALGADIKRVALLQE